MRVLFVPCRNGGMAHRIPLLALWRRLSESVESAFLLPGASHEEFRQLGAKVLQIDHDSLRTEMMAYAKFQPDLVVDDFSDITGFAAVLKRLPRVTIQRTGIFPGALPRNRSHKHSSGYDINDYTDVAKLGLEKPKSLADLFWGDVKIVPGIKSIEMLPDNLKDDPTYYYSGPLLTDDYLVPSDNRAGSPNAALSEFKDFNPLRNFFKVNQDRKIVYVTFGTVAEAGKEIVQSIEYLLNNGVAVITSISTESMNERKKELFYYAKYLPMHFICSRADLVIHHCGSGTYHYPILHEAPMITVGTMCYDRDDVAMRLQELGISEHIPAPEESENFGGDLRRSVERMLYPSEEADRRVKMGLALLKAEIQRTILSFNFEQVLLDVAGRSKGSRVRAP